MGIDMKKYRTFDEMYNDDSYVSPEEREQINFEVSLIEKMIEAREAKGLSQRELAELSGVKQPAIARMESMKSTPQIDTLIKVLIPLGYTLEIVALKQSMQENTFYLHQNTHMQIFKTRICVFDFYYKINSYTTSARPHS